MNKLVQSFGGSLAITAAVVALSALLGGVSAAYIVVLLGILEVSLSFDNAVVNAKVLGGMDPVWQRRFILFGIPIAVIGMRFAFPILIVAATTDLSIAQVYKLALADPLDYRAALESGLHLIYAFAGAFLLMIGLGWFFGEERETHWIALLENNPVCRTLNKIASVEVVIALVILLALDWRAADMGMTIAYLCGMSLNMLVGALDDLFSTNGIKAGFAGLLYLEVLDASFSFDGVLGAFALSTNIFVIAAGLGIGALFVRSLTLYMVRNGTLDEYVYLEHGAHYAILTLAVLMLTKMYLDVSEIVTGTLGAGFIIAAWLTSLVVRRKEAVA